MKSYPARLAKRNTAGMTLLELTVVILVLLSLIAILFIGATSWKKGADRAANILNIRNVQQAVRAHSNTHGLAIGDALASTDIVGGGRYLNQADPPNASVVYTYGTTVPAMGTLYLIATYSDAIATSEFAPDSDSYVDW